MKRLAAIAAIVGASLIAALGLGAGEDDGGRYLVRAIFDNAAFVIPGEDVKVAGVKVGTIDDVDVTDDFRAAVVLDIQEPGFRDFRSDARCIVRPQSLIGEKFVECTPTRPRAAGTQPPPALRRIEDGPGAGQYLLPVENTTRSVDLDLVNNIMRRPFRERFSIILNEFGTTVAGRGADLNAVIRRANPALRELDDVLKVLASQNEVLADLASNSDRALAPLARERRHVSGFIESAGEVAQATAESSEALEANLERLPTFLRELRPTLQRLGSLSDQMTPVLSDLGDVAPEINTFVTELGPFSRAGIPAFDTLGDTARAGIPALEDARPVIQDLRAFARAVKPAGKTLAAVLESFRKTDGIESLMDWIFYQATAVNGFDQLGHYLRAALLVNTCSSYSVDPVPGCSARFSDPSASASAASAEPQISGDDVLDMTAKVLRGADPQQVLSEHGREDARKQAAAEATKDTQDESLTAAAPSAPAPPADDAAAPVLDYLFGSDAG